MHSYGNLYFAADGFRGCESAIVGGSVPSHIKKEIQERYVIGPVVEESYWQGSRAKIESVRGPCKSRIETHISLIL